MKYTEQAVETLDDAGSVIANKNIEIEQLRQRVAELEKGRDSAYKIADHYRAERDECEANSGQWEQEYYKVCKERDALTAEVHRQKNCIRGLTDQCAALVVEKNSLLMDHGGALCDRAKIEMLEALLAGDGALITGLKDDIAQLTAERDKANQYWQIAEGRCDALMKQRDELVESLRETLDFVERHSNRWDGVNGKHPFTVVEAARAAIASVKEKS